nr:hypothetical protein [Jeotgalibacillus malaysiensis]
MYWTRMEKANKLSDKQVELLLLLESGLELVHNEGAGFRCWLEKNNKKIPYTVRNATANVVMELNLMKLLPVKGYLYRHELNEEGKLVLDVMDKSKKEKARRSLQKAGLDHYLLATTQGGN